MNESEICYMPAVELAEAIRARKVSPVEAVDAVLDRIERINPKLNAYCTVVADEARESAKKAEAAVARGEELGPLHGVPVSIKDLVFTKGIRTTSGSKMYRDFVPDEDETCVARLREAGAIIVGKTNTPEFGYKGVTDNPLFGITRNPWNRELTPGGSSGGAGAAVATGLAPLAIGTDGGGSIRIPSSFCGIFGLKPSYGRVARYPTRRGWQTLSHAGPMTRTVRDAALMLDVIAGPDDRDRHSLPDARVSYLGELEDGITGLRIAWSPDLGYATVDPRVRQITQAAVKTFDTLDCDLEEVSRCFSSPEEIFSTLVASETAASLEDELDTWKDEMDPPLLRFIEIGQRISIKQYIQAIFKRTEFYVEAQRPFEKYDLLLTPTLAVPPFEVGVMGPQQIDGKKVTPIGWLAFTFPFNLTGQPAATVPCGWTDDGLPIGLQIVGRRYDDLTVLKAAAAFEEAAPWADKRPPVDETSEE